MEDSIKNEYIKKALPQVILEPELTHFAHQISSKKKFPSIKVLSISPLKKTPPSITSEMKNMELPKLIIPNFPDNLIGKTIDNTRKNKLRLVSSVINLLKRKQKKSRSPHSPKNKLLILKRKNSYLPTFRKSAIELPVTELDGISYNPEDFIFKSLPAKKPSEPKSPEKAKKSPNKRIVRDLNFVDFIESKQCPEKHKLERLKFIKQNSDYSQELLDKVSKKITNRRQSLDFEDPEIMKTNDTKNASRINLPIFTEEQAKILGLPINISKDSSGRRQKIAVPEDEYDPRSNFDNNIKKIELNIGELRRKRKDAEKCGYKQVKKVFDEFQKEIISSPNFRKYFYIPIQN